MSEKNRHHVPEKGGGILAGKNAGHSRPAARKSVVFWTKRLGYRLFRLSGELTAIVLGTAFLWFYTLNALLAKQTLDVSFLKPNISHWFTQAFDGRTATISDMTLTWRPEIGAIVLDTHDILVKDARGISLQDISRLQATFDFDDVLKGRTRPQAIDITGGVVTWRKGLNGGVVAGLGSPDTVGRFGTFISEDQSPGGSGEPFTMSGLTRLNIQDTDVYIQNLQTGFDFKLVGTDLILTDAGERFQLAAQAIITAGQDESPVDVNLTFSPDYEDFDLAFHTPAFNGAKFAPKANMLATLKRIDAPAEIRLDLSAERAVGLKKVSLDITIGSGEIDIGPQTSPLEGFTMRADYDPEAQILRAETVELRSGPVTLKGQAEFSQIGRPATGFLKEPVIFSASLSDTRVDAGKSLDAPLKARSIDLSGTLDALSRQLTFSLIDMDFTDYQINASAVISRKPDGGLSALSGRGRIDGDMSPENLLSMWPTEFATGARRWIARSVLSGKIQNLDFNFDINEAAFSGKPLANKDVRVTFDVADADVRYISTMTPYTGVSGRGILRGNSFEMTTNSGAVGGLEVTRGHVNIPRFNPIGADFTIDVQGRGSVQDMLVLIDQKPFEFASRYGIMPDSFSGRGAIDLSIKRPLLEFFDQNRIIYAVKGDFTDVGVPFELGGHKLEKGVFRLQADKDGMSLNGPVNLGPWRANMSWEENFSEVSPTVYRLSGPMSRETLDGFGLGLREYFGGEIFMTVDALGKGLTITESSLKADLTAADIRAGEYWSKAAGVAADLTASVTRSGSGAINVEAMKVAAPGLSLGGHLAFGPNMELVEFTFDEAKIDGFVDGQVTVKPNADKTLFDVKASGAFLDISPFVSQAITAQATSMSLPMTLSVDVDRLALSEMFILSGAELSIDHNGIGTRAARITGDMSEGPFRAELTPKPGENGRHLSIDMPNASVAVMAFLKSTNIRGGRLNMTADLPNVGEEGALTGVIDIEDAVVVRAPILAQMLSLASLKGLTDTMGGAGLEFRQVSIPFSYEGGDLSVRDGRASGPALGLTGSGDISFPDKYVDFDGVLVPAYTANSVLESIPLIGDIFVGKKGEGIFALSYAVKGPFSATQVGVNPLSALTPGFMRRIFDTQRDDLPEIGATETKPVADPPNPDGPR